MIGSAWCRKLLTVAPVNFLTLTDRSFHKFLSITPFKIQSPIKTQVFGGHLFVISPFCNLNWASFYNLTSRGWSSIEMLGMTLIDLALSEFFVVSKVVDNMSHCGGAICVFFEFGILESLLQLLFVVMVLQFCSVCCYLIFQMFLKVSRSLNFSFSMPLLVIELVLDIMHENLIMSYLISLWIVLTLH